MAEITYMFLNDTIAEGEKMPPQLKTILATLKELGPDAVSKEKLVEALSKPTDTAENQLNARQPVERVVGFYQKRMVDAGHVEMTKTVAEKPAKAAKDKKVSGGKPKVPEAVDVDALAG